ncbi:MAG: hypothetical protein JWL97_3933 [Gemmatimonadales bacterium]|jgi:hypothetical protein|nr:hypothetical protein [Gemmatimonadales bacterium]
MNRSSLKQLLDAEHVHPQSYDLDGGLPNERYCLEERASGWSVYYSERGSRTGERTFPSEDEACRDLLDRLLRDTTTRISGSGR